MFSAHCIIVFATQDDAQCALHFFMLLHKMMYSVQCTIADAYNLSEKTLKEYAQNISSACTISHTLNYFRLKQCLI